MEPSLFCAFEGAASGATNMARDRAMLRAVEAAPVPLVLVRVYTWNPPAVSLGFHQPLSGIDVDGVRARGFDLVRRPTGGAAVLHADEWTYAIAGALDLPAVGRSVAEIYSALGDCLRRALQALGVQAELAGAGRPAGFSCFASAGGHEIAVAGRKLVGSALRRGRRGFLQHGSILRGPAHRELADWLRGADARLSAPAQALFPRPGPQVERLLLAARTTDLCALGRADLAGEELARALAREVERMLDTQQRWCSSLDGVLAGVGAEAAG